MNKMVQKILVKREPEGNYIIFFPDTLHYDYDEISCYTHKDGHNNASRDYVRKCQHVEYLAENVVKFVDDYVKYIRTLPDFEDYEVKPVKSLRK
jgi:hypothetical protein